MMLVKLAICLLINQVVIHGREGKLYKRYPVLPPEMKGETSVIDPFFRGKANWVGKYGLMWKLSDSARDNTKTRKRWIAQDHRTKNEFSVLWTASPGGYRAFRISEQFGGAPRYYELKGGMNFKTFDDAEEHIQKYRRTIAPDRIR